MQAGKQTGNRFDYAKPGPAVSDSPEATAIKREHAMTFNVDFDEARNLIRVVATGHANKAARLESLRAVRMDPHFRDDYRILCNFRDNKYVPDSAECRHLGLTVSAFFRGQKIALVVSKAELAKLKENIAIFNTGRVEINAFNSLTSAKNWLLAQQEAIAAERLARN
jgi:hypothetical protein